MPDHLDIARMTKIFIKKVIVLQTRIFFTIIIALISLFNFSCEENFSPKETFKERNILYCIIEVDQRLLNFYPQVFITKIYDIDGFYPPTDHGLPPSVTGAEVSIKLNNDVFKFEQDTLKQNSEDPNAPQIYYSLISKNGIPAKPLNELAITAKLPDNTVLTAKTKIPKLLEFSYSYEFNAGIHTMMDRWQWGNAWTLYWDVIEGNLYLPRLTLNYSIIKDSVETYKSFVIPNKYLKSGNKYVANFPGFLRTGELSYDYAAIDSAMANISAGDSSKSSYNIINIVLDILEYDVSLSNYFTSINGYMDNLSIRLDESVYTNVDGGIGLFATYIKHKTVYQVAKGYVLKFGYNKKN